MSLANWFRNLFSSRPRTQGPQGPQGELGRNEPCWCGSGKKYKKCHLKSDEAKQLEANYSARVAASRNRSGGGIVPGGTAKGKARPERAAELPRR